MSLYKRLFRYLRPYRKELIYAVICMGFVAALNAGRIYLIKPLQDDVFVGKNPAMLRTLMWAIPVMSVFLGLFSYLQNYLMAYVGQKSIGDLRQHMFDHVQQMSMDFFGASSTGKVVARFTNDLTALQQVIARAPIYCVRDGLTAIFNIGLIFYLNWRFALMIVALLPVSAIIIVSLGKTLRRVGRKGQEQMGDLYTVIQENIQAAAVVKAYTAERTESSRFKKANDHFIELGLRFAKADTISSPLMEMIGALVLSLLLWKGGEDVMRGAWTSGSFLAFIAYAVMTYRPMKNFAELNAQLQLGLASSERIFELLDEVASVQEAPHAKILRPFQHVIEYDNVSFQYPTAERPALRDFSLMIRAGEMIALVGSSGAGKSTAALLLPRFYDPLKGAIRIDDQDIRDVTQASLRGQIGYVTQDVLLFNESVRYNIAYGRPNATEEDIRAAAEAANAHSFISRMPNGYDTIIGERGLRLSGGERQRLSIARALLKNPAILILDEATSALDAESERLVQQALERLMEHRTALVIAHRLSTVRKADRIIVMDHGRMAEEGSHTALIDKQGIYFKLHNLQVLH